MEYPYESNCTKSWTRTNYTKLVQDSNGSYGSHRQNNSIKYNLPVIYQHKAKPNQFGYLLIPMQSRSWTSTFVFISLTHSNVNEFVCSAALWWIVVAFILCLSISTLTGILLDTKTMNWNRAIWRQGVRSRLYCSVIFAFIMPCALCKHHITFKFY